MKTLASLLLILALPVSALPVSALAQTASDPQHERLAALAGHWTVQQSLWLGDSATPQVDSGAADYTIAVKHQLQQRLTIDDGTGFEGLGYIGYDNASGKFFSTWMDVNFPGLVVAYGDFDAASNSYTFKGSMTAAAGDVPVREVMTQSDADHFSYAYYETRNGQESLTVRLDYTRTK